MSETIPKTLTSGEFAKIVGVTYQTLQRYDKEGVFSPAIKTQGGWRKYTYDQIAAFHDLRRKRRKAAKNTIVGYIQAPISNPASNLKSRAYIGYSMLSSYVQKQAKAENFESKMILNDEELHSFNGQGFQELLSLVQSGIVSRVILAFDNQFNPSEQSLIDHLCKLNNVSLEIMPEAQRFNLVSARSFDEWKEQVLHLLEQSKDATIPESILLADHLMSILQPPSIQ